MRQYQKAVSGRLLSLAGLQDSICILAHSLYGLCSIDLVLSMPCCLCIHSPVLTHLDAGSQGSLLECWSGKYATQVKQYDDDVETAIRAAWCASAALHIVKTCFVVFCSQPANG